MWGDGGYVGRLDRLCNTVAFPIGQTGHIAKQVGHMTQIGLDALLLCPGQEEAPARLQNPVRAPDGQKSPVFSFGQSQQDGIDGAGRR